MIGLTAGVYGTNMHPSEGKSAIGFNNWRFGGSGRVSSGRADYYIK
jgi:hypothetical protein